MQSPWRTLLALLTACLLAGCAAHLSPEVSLPRHVSGQKFEFTDLHSTNTYFFLPGGRYRFTAVSRNGLFTDRRDGLFTFRAAGPRRARIVFDGSSVLDLAFDAADTGTCKVDDDVRVYRFRLSGGRG